MSDPVVVVVFTHSGLTMRVVRMGNPSRDEKRWFAVESLGRDRLGEPAWSDVVTLHSGDGEKLGHAPADAVLYRLLCHVSDMGDRTL